MRSIITTDGQYSEPSVEEILRLIAAPDSNGFWLDIERPDDSDYSLLLDGFRFHPLTVEDVRQANQRPKMDEFPGYCFTVLFTAELAGDRLIFREHHLYLAGSRLVTIHHEREPALEELRRRIRGSPDLTRNDSEFLHYLCSASWSRACSRYSRSWTRRSTSSRTPSSAGRPMDSSVASQLSN